MAEISRKESKSAIKKWLGCNDCDTDECLSSICVDCKNHYDEDEFRQALEKAISDMEKLEKIEQELNYDCRTDESINCLECKPKYDRGCNSCLETRRLEKIEQILRGENE